MGIKYTIKKNGPTWEVRANGEYIKHFFSLGCAEAFLAGVYYQAELIAEPLRASLR